MRDRHRQRGFLHAYPAVSEPRTCWAVHSHNANGEEHPHAYFVTLAKVDGTRPVEGSEELEI